MSEDEVQVPGLADLSFLPLQSLSFSLPLQWPKK